MTKPIIIAGLFSVLLEGCATPPPPAAVRIVATPDKLLRFDRLRAGTLPGSLLVRGRITRMRRYLDGRYLGRIPGHIHVEAFAGGTSLGWQDTRWRRFSNKPFAKAPFAVHFPLDPNRVDEIRVSYDSGTEGHQSRPGNPS